MHFQIEGPVVAQIQAAFNDNWIKITGEVLNGGDYFPPQAPAGDMDAQMFIASPAGGSESMHLMYLMAIAAAGTSIDLEASYFVPDDLVLAALLAARGRKVRVRILLPGKHRLRNRPYRLEGPLGAAAQSGVEIYEYQPTMMHNKVLIVDREMVSVGSTNFDPRSFRLNDEASLNVYDREFAERMSAAFEEDLEATQRYTLEMWRRRPLKERFVEKVILPIRSQL